MNNDDAVTVDLVPPQNEYAEGVERKEKKRVRGVTLRRRTLALLAAVGVLIVGYDVVTTEQNHQQGGTIIAQNRTLKQKDKDLAGALHEVIVAQQAGHATLNAITGLQQQFSAAETSVGNALIDGQKALVGAQNVYLGYLTCLITHMESQAVCGAAPPLPPT